MLKASFIGYLGADCNQKQVGDQVAITFSVGVTKQYKNRQGQPMTHTTWVGCTIWRKPEHTRIAEFLKRGQQVYVEGEPSARAWINQSDNTARSVLDCRVDNIELVGKSPTASSPAAEVPATSAPVQSNENDDLPF